MGFLLINPTLSKKRNFFCTKKIVQAYPSNKDLHNGFRMDMKKSYDIFYFSLSVSGKIFFPLVSLAFKIF